MVVDLLYLVKANVVLAVVVTACYGLLRQLTFFKLNRLYLVVVVLFAAVYPSLPIPALLPASTASLAAVPALPALRAGTASAVVSPLAGDWHAFLQMLNQPASSNRQLPRYLLAAPLVMLLALGYSGARTRVKPVTELRKDLPVEALHYLEGQVSSQLTVQQLSAGADLITLFF